MPDLHRAANVAKADRRVAWWLVWLYPSAFRRDVGLGLVDALDDRMRARRAAGASSVGVRLPAIADTLRNAPVEWMGILRQYRPAPPDWRKRTMTDTLLQDIRFALRLWRRRPTFAAVAILTLALGVGANTAMFSIVNAVLLRPLPYPNADRLITVFTKSTNFRQGLLSYQEYEEIRRQSRSIEAIGLVLGQSVNITGSSEPQRLVGTFASGAFFDVLGLKAERGRLFSEEDSAPGTVKPVVVLSHRLWRQRYNEDASAIGQTLTVNGAPLTIVGVMETPAAMMQSPGDGYFIGGVDLFLPVAQYPTPRGLRSAFKTLRIPLLKGRDFTDRDDLTTPLVAVINETFAKREWSGEDPIGKQFTTPNTAGPVTVIGIVGDTKHYTATEAAMPQLYAAHYQVPLIFSSLVARVPGPPMAITNDVKKAIWAVDKDQPVWTIRSLDAQVGATMGQSRFLALLLGIFAGVALLLAGVGIYGVTSYGVAQRTHEIGIRLALGASGDRVLRDVVGRGVRLTLIAVAIGLVGAVAMGRLASTVLFGVTPIDPPALAAAAMVLGAVSIAACYIPARRASRVDPVVALAQE